MLRALLAMLLFGSAAPDPAVKDAAQAVQNPAVECQRISDSECAGDR